VILSWQAATHWNSYPLHPPARATWSSLARSTTHKSQAPQTQLKAVKQLRKSGQCFCIPSTPCPKCPCSCAVATIIMIDLAPSVYSTTLYQWVVLWVSDMKSDLFYPVTSFPTQGKCKMTISWGSQEKPHFVVLAFFHCNTFTLHWISRLTSCKLGRDRRKNLIKVG
jgi:hypothetical protein